MDSTAEISDQELIDALGGPLAVVQRLGLPRYYGLTRVCNWRARGIPFKIRLQYLAMWKEAGKIVLAHRRQGKPLPTYWNKRRAAATSRIGL